MLMLAGLGFIDLSTALLADIALSVVSLLVTLAKSAKTKENSLKTAVVVGVAHCIVVSAIILLKSLAK
jgi:cytochrome c biogenesis factor